MEADGSALFLTYISLFLGSCVGFILLLNNLAGLFSYSREDTDGESASAMAIAASIFASLLAIVLSRVETGRMYAEESSLAGATPCRMATVNGVANILIWVLLTGGLIAAFL